MSFRLRNQNNPEMTLGLNTRTWFGILEMAEEHGWNPMGTVIPEWEYESYGSYRIMGVDDEYQDCYQGEYWNDDRRLVVFEDALNLADALEKALLEYRPQPLPSLRVYALFSDLFDPNGSHPSIGAIQAVIELCQPGAFYIEKF